MKQLVLLMIVLLINGYTLEVKSMEATESKEKDVKEIPVIGHKYIADFGENRYLLDFLSDKQIEIKVLQGFGKNQIVNYNRTLVRPNVYMVTWQESDSSTVTHLEDFEQGIVYTNMTMSDLAFYNYKGTLSLADNETPVSNVRKIETSDRQKNIDIVTRFLDLAFNKNDVEGAAQLVTERYIQHNPFVADGRNGFMEGIKGFHTAYPDINWKLKHVYADGEYVITHSQYEEGESYATVDIFRMKDGKIDEHWDVKQQIPTSEESANKNTMF